MAPYSVLVHEAGHSVVARLLGLRTEGYAESEDYFCALGEVSPDPRVRKAVLCGGAAAEIAVYGEVVSPASALRGDLEEFRSWRNFLHTAQRWAVKISLQALAQEIKKARAQLNCQPASW